MKGRRYLRPNAHHEAVGVVAPDASMKGRRYLRPNVMESLTLTLTVAELQ